MADRIHYRPLPLFVLVTIPLLLFTLISCDENPPTCPIYEVGAIEGRITAAGQPVAAHLGARALDGLNHGRIIMTTHSDSTGWYRMDLPTGLYQMITDPNMGQSLWSSDRRDTVTVTPAIHRLDLARGRAEIRVTVPTEFENDHFNLSVSGYSSDGFLERDRVESGRLEFVRPLVQPGAYVMTLSQSNQSHRIYLPGGVAQGDCDTLHVGIDEPTVYEIDFTDTFASIGGTITGSWQAADIYPPKVVAFSADSTEIGGVRCANDGVFNCHLFVAQPVKLMVEIDNIDSWIGGSSFADATVFEVEPGDQITGVAMVESGLSILLDNGEGEDRIRSTITLRDETDTILVDSHYNSEFAICNLSPGRYYLHADGTCDDEVWFPQWFDGATDLEDATPIDITEGELREIVMTLVEGGRIEGVVTYWDGSPISSPYMGLFIDETELPGQCGGDWSYHYGGNFDFSGLADGDYYLTMKLTDGTPFWYPGTIDFAEAEPFTITDHEAIEDIVWTLPEPKQEVRP